MIPGDFLYTNYFCRSALLLTRDFYSDYKPNMDYIVLKLMGKKIFFRRKGNDFILVNQYGEKSILRKTKAWIKVLIAKALKDSGENFRDIRINGENVDVHFNDLLIIGEVASQINTFTLESLTNHSSGNLGCKVPCPFKRYCQDGIEPTTSYNPQNNLYYLTLYSSIVDLILSSDILLAGINLVDRYIDNFGNLQRKLNGILAKLSQEIGYDRADALLWLGRKVMMGERVKDTELNLEDYGGYITRVGKWIIPTDKFWNLVYGEGKEEKIRGLYEIWGD